MGLVEAHWSHDGGEVGLLVCNMFNKHLSAIVGYDLAHGRAVDGSAFRSVLGEQIRKKYSLPKDSDAINWACSQSGNAAYSSHR
jgi:phosphoribosylaminoimidazole carboxylase (NCAIR synthetase)